MEIDYLSIGLRIKKMRNEKQITQEQLAEAIDSDQAVIARIEKGYKGFSLEYLIKISNALGISANELLADSLIHSDNNDPLRYLLIDCTPSESAFLMKCFSAIKNILTDYTIK